MKSSGKCPKCGSPEIIADAKAMDATGPLRGHLDLSVGRFLKPEAIILRDWKSTTLSAWVCGGCGFVEFYADEPTTLLLPKSTD